MDEEIERLLVSVRADTAGFARDVAQMRSELDGPLADGVERAGRALQAREALAAKMQQDGNYFLRRGTLARRAGRWPGAFGEPVQARRCRVRADDRTRDAGACRRAQAGGASRAQAGGQARAGQARDEQRRRQAGRARRWRQERRAVDRVLICAAVA